MGGVGGSPAAGTSSSARALKASGSAPARESSPHFVTVDQLSETSRAGRASVVDFQAVAHDRGRVSFADLSGDRPTVLVFVKDGCPCSVQFQPVFNRMARAFDGRVQFVGIIDGPLDVARQYARANDVPYSVLADADLAIIAQFEVKNAAYVALVEADGTLRSMWPGCSVSMCQDLCGKAADLCAAGGAALDRVALEFPEMPAPLTSGCPFQF
jgi:peroxiredoxin